MASTAPALLRRPAHSLTLARLPELWHLLSLDAPTVAALWAWTFARAAHIALPLSALAILALGTWLVYIADRILDGMRPSNATHLRERHFFHARHRTGFLIAALFAGAVLLRLIATDMAPLARREDCWLFSAALLYFAVIHLIGGLRGAKIERWFPKEIAVGTIFALATAVPAWSRAPEAHGTMVFLVTLFAALCCLNCLAIEAWESAAAHLHPSELYPSEQYTSGLSVSNCHPDRSSRRQAVAQRRDLLSANSPIIRWSQKHFFLIALTTAMAASTLTALSSDKSSAALCLSALISALLLALLHAQRHRLSILHLRIAADAALLTPLLLLLPFHQ